MNKKILETLQKIMFAIIAVSLICSIIVSQDTHHIDTCEDEHCQICSIIHIAQIIVNLTISVFICVFASFMINYVLSRMHKEVSNFMHKSLVFQKVQMNE